MPKYPDLQLRDFIHQTVPLRPVPLSLCLFILREILSQYLGTEVVTAPFLCPRSGFELSSDRDQPGAAPLASPSVSAFGPDRENSATETK